MTDFKISDYGIFTDAIKTTNNYNEKISDANNDINNYKLKLCSESIFLGPACDQAVSGCGSVSSKLTNLSDNCKKINNYLINSSKNYKSGDDNAKDNIISVTNT